MKLLFDLFPVILFFVAYKFQGIYVATAVAILTTFAQVGWSWLRHRRVEPMLWASLAVIVLFGGATLWLHDEQFIKWKPTVLYWLLSAVLILSWWLFRRNFIMTLLASQVSLPGRIWTLLNLAWAAFFAVLGGLNLLVAALFSTDAWVNFKLFGTTALMLAFVVAQALFLSRHMEAEQTEADPPQGGS